MRSFFLSLISSGDNSVSSKRFVAIIGSFVVFIIALCNLFFRMNIAEFIFFGILSYCCGLFGLNTFLSSKAMDTKTKIASDIVNQEPNPDSADQAADVLQSPHP